MQISKCMALAVLLSQCCQQLGAGAAAPSSCGWPETIPLSENAPLLLPILVTLWSLWCSRSLEDFGSVSSFYPGVKSTKTPYCISWWAVWTKESTHAGIPGITQLMWVWANGHWVRLLLMWGVYSAPGTALEVRKMQWTRDRKPGCVEPACWVGR